MDNPFQSVRDDVIVRLTHKGEDAARDYIGSLSDADLRDAARVHLATFLAAASLATSDNCDTALEMVREVEDIKERMDALLAIVRLFNSHHRLPKAKEILGIVEEQSKQNTECADFAFLVAVEYERLGLKNHAVNNMSRAIAAALDSNDERLAAGGALWLARWGVDGEPERIINALSVASLKERSCKQLTVIRDFQRQCE